ncbi:MAG: carbohydrate kinase family protein [Patescibacteria group bacterium]
MSKVCVIGSATWDALLTTDQAKLIKGKSGQKTKSMLAFSYGAKIDASDTIYTFGGGASNVSVGLNRLGISASVYTHLGRDWRGREIINHLKAERVDVKSITFDRERHSAMSLIVTSGAAREHIAFVDRGASSGLQLKTKLASGTYNWFYLTAITTLNWPAMLRKFFTASSRAGKKIFWNPGSRQLASAKALKPLLKYLTVLDLNKEEATKLVRDLGKKAKNEAQILKTLWSLGPEIVLITCGAKGAYCFDGKSFIYYPSYKLKAVNTIGAGDAFGSGWLAGFIHSRGKLIEAMRWGMSNSNSVILKMGAQRGLLRRGEIKKFLLQHHK